VVCDSSRQFARYKSFGFLFFQEPGDLPTDLGGVDLLGEVLGLGSFEQLNDVSIEVDGFDRKIWTLNLPALIKVKKAAGREK
jgi:hypothetical protein